ncbi:hypothetical protein CA51_30400 [Rosistilla oblonga]|nr:hypothetical protein CA51_30400 [Rosistilla oblonga]
MSREKHVPSDRESRVTDLSGFTPPMDIGTIPTLTVWHYWTRKTRRKPATQTPLTRTYKDVNLCSYYPSTDGACKGTRRFFLKFLSTPHYWGASFSPSFLGYNGANACLSSVRDPRSLPIFESDSSIIGGWSSPPPKKIVIPPISESSRCRSTVEISSPPPPQRAR